LYLLLAEDKLKDLYFTVQLYCLDAPLGDDEPSGEDGLDMKGKLLTS